LFTVSTALLALLGSGKKSGGIWLDIFRNEEISGIFFAVRKME
jgi:hypothetical protein